MMNDTEYRSKLLAILGDIADSLRKLSLNKGLSGAHDDTSSKNLLEKILSICTEKFVDGDEFDLVSQAEDKLRAIERLADPWRCSVCKESAIYCDLCANIQKIRNPDWDGLYTCPDCGNRVKDPTKCKCRVNR